MNPMQERTALLLGSDGMEALSKARVIVAGLGGVGGHCTEALARAGVGNLHLIDMDVVAESNLNRQLIATKSTIGMQKTAVMTARLQDVSNCLVTVSNAFLAPDTAEEALPIEADFLIDAIDHVPGKVALVSWAAAHGVPILSCMGAGNRLDPGQLTITDLFSTSGDPLARKFRSALRKIGITALPVVFSTEPAHTSPGQTTIGSLAPVTATAGLMAAAYAIRYITGKL